tara:strand:- start:1223 stop:2131 length:909 start_codon:yes stop_codon:yes gene_type:complete
MKILSGNIDLEVKDFGPKDNNPLIMISGYGSQLIDWPKSFINKLIKYKIRVIIFDNRDVGLSHKFSGESIEDPKLIWRYSYSKEKLNKETKKPKIPYTLTNMAEDCVNILDALDIDKAHILGTSMGGMIAQLVAFNFSKRCKSLISVMSTSGNPELPRPSREVIEGLNHQPKSSNKEDVIENNLMTRKLWASPKFSTSEGILKENFSYRYDRMYYPEGLIRQYAAIGDDGDRSKRLQKIAVPTLVLHGASDNLVPVEAGIDTQRNISGSKIEILDGWGHDLPEGTHDWIVDKIHNHIKSCNE